MTTIHVVSLLIRLDGGGAERSVERLIAPLAKNGVVLARYAIDDAWPGEERDPSRTLVRGSVRGARRLLLAAISLAKVLRQSSPQVLHLNCEAPEIVGLIARIITIRQKYGIVVTDHSMNSWSGKRAPLGWLIRGVLHRLGAVYVDCYLADGEDRKVPVILNPTGPPSRLTPGPGCPPRLVVIGRVIESKGIDRILTAAHSCSWTNQICVIGAGAETERLKQLAVELDLDVTFLGHQKSPWSFVRDSDIFISASAFEGEPLTLIEAIQHDLPVLVSDIPGHVKVVPAHPGIFASVEELSKILGEWAQNPRSAEMYRVSPSLRERVLSDRAPDRIARDWVTLYTSLKQVG